jgi:hypothetical protein
VQNAIFEVIRTQFMVRQSRPHQVVSAAGGIENFIAGPIVIKRIKTARRISSCRKLKVSMRNTACLNPCQCIIDRGFPKAFREAYKGQNRGTKMMTNAKTIKDRKIPTRPKSLKRYPPGPITRTFTGWLTGVRNPEDAPSTTVMTRG